MDSVVLVQDYLPVMDLDQASQLARVQAVSRETVENNTIQIHNSPLVTDNVGLYVISTLTIHNMGVNLLSLELMAQVQLSTVVLEVIHPVWVDRHVVQRDKDVIQMVAVGSLGEKRLAQHSSSMRRAIMSHQGIEIMKVRQCAASLAKMKLVLREQEDIMEG